MKQWTAFVLTLALAAGSLVAAQMSPDDQRALREGIERHFDVVPLSDAVALRPRARMRDVRLIEIGSGGISINGDPVTGRELRDRLGSDADLVIRLSYLSADERRLVFAPKPVEAEAPADRPSAEAPATGSGSQTIRTRRSTGERVRVFGNVNVDENEEIGGQVVAVMGSVRIDGEVGDQVVAVLGSVVLGPHAVVRGDVISVGGTVRRAEGAQIRGSITEVSLNNIDGLHVAPWASTWTPFYFFNSFSAVPRLIGSTFRLGLLILLSLIALVIARPTVERSAARVAENPLKAILVGLLAEILLVPVFVLVAIVLSVSIVGIPLLVLMPFACLLLVLMALAGFSGTACAIGQWLRRRFGLTHGSAVFDVIIGVIVILLPVLFGRVLALAGWPVTPLVVLLIASGFAIELLAWASGFGAVLTNVLSRWQARRSTRSPLTSPPVA
jgi:hypothetical protein